jgi:hypothetical protein
MESVASIEKGKSPEVGLVVTRRALQAAGKGFLDPDLQCRICCLCAQTVIVKGVSGKAEAVQWATSGDLEQLHAEGQSASTSKFLQACG